MKTIIIQKLLRIAQTPRESIGEVGFANVKLTNESALRVSVNHVLETAYSDISLEDTSSFFPPRENFDQYQAVIISSNGTRIESKISRIYGEDFILSFKSFEPIPEKMEKEQYRKIFRTEKLHESDTYRTAVNGGWFWDEKAPGGAEYSLVILVKKPEYVFKRYTIVMENNEENNEQNLIPTPKLIMDNYTRTQFDYPLLFSKEFFAAVYSEYITLRLDKYIINKATAEIPEVPHQENKPKKFKIKKMPISSADIDLKNIDRLYEDQLPFLQELRRGAIDLISRSNANAIDQVLERAYRDPSGYSGPELDDKAILKRIKELEQEKADAAAMGIPSDEIDKQIKDLRNSIDTSGASSDDDFNKVVFEFGEKLGTTPSEQMVKDLKPKVEQLNAEINKDIRDKLKGESRINAPAFMSKNVTVPYVTPVPRMQERDGAGIIFNINLPGQLSMIRTPGNPPTFQRHHTESATPNIDISFPNFHKVNRGFDFYQQIKDFFRHVLGAKQSQRGLSQHTKPQSQFYEERFQSESLIKTYEKDIEALQAELMNLKEVANKYHVQPLAGEPQQFNPDGTIKHPLAYIRDLEHYIYEFRKHLPKTLDEIEQILSAFGGDRKLKKKDLSLLRIILDK
jgi:hypothetical protein